LTESSFAIPQPKTRRVTLYLNREFGKFGIGLGGIWAGQPLQAESFSCSGEEGNYTVYKDKIKSQDNTGKIKFTYEGGRLNWYAKELQWDLWLRAELTRR
jgi:hypothetical protein